MNLERTILDFLAATLVAMDGARAGPLPEALTRAEINDRVVRPVLAGAEAGSFRQAIESLALRARSLLGGGTVDLATLSRHLDQLTDLLLERSGDAGPVASVLAQGIAAGLDGPLSEELLQSSFAVLTPLDGLDFGLDVPAALDATGLAAGAPGDLPGRELPGPLNDDDFLAPPDPVAAAEAQPTGIPRLNEPSSELAAAAAPAPPNLPKPLAVAPPSRLQPETPAIENLPRSPMVTAIAQRHGLAEIGLLRIAQHPAVAEVSLAQLERVLDNSASMLKQLALGLADSSTKLAGPLERQARMAILDGDLTVADTLLSGLEARESTAIIGANAPEPQHRRRIAEICALRAGLAEARLDHDVAANFYGNAIAALDHADTEMTWLYALRQGTALQTAYEYRHDPQALERAVVVYAQAIEHGAPHGPPQQPGLATLWVLTQNSLGNALTVLGERNGDLERLRLAAWSYGQALSAKNRADGAAEWALLQSNYAHALVKVADLAMAAGSQQPGNLAIDSLNSAVSAWSEASEVYRALNNQSAQFNVMLARAMAQTRLGFLSKDAATLQAAAESLAATAAATPPATGINDRIRVASSLGDVCAELAEASGDRAWLARAIDAYEAAFELVSTDPASPPASTVWAGAATNLANALWTAGRLTGDRNQLLKADNLFSSAAAAFETGNAIQPAAAIHHALKELRAVLAQLQSGQHFGAAAGQPQSMTMR